MDSLSRQEDQVAAYLQERLSRIGLEVKKDTFGNVIGYLEGEGEPILLNAHMDGVGPAKGHKPRLENGILRSDCTTNLRADDAAGLTVILEALEELARNNTKHIPVVVGFTRQEEIGLFGAKALDVSEYGVKHGIVFDNGKEAGVVIIRGGAYRAINIKIAGKSAHPAKDMESAINPVDVFVGAGITSAMWDGGETTVNMGVGKWGAARNMVPGEMELIGELRSFSTPQEIEDRVVKIKQAFEQAARGKGATLTFEAVPLAESYEVGRQEPLLLAYERVLKARGAELRTGKTLIASDANAFRQNDLDMFVISTGVQEEHSLEEWIMLSDMEMLAIDLVELLSQGV